MTPNPSRAAWSLAGAIATCAAESPPSAIDLGRLRQGIALHHPDLREPDGLLGLDLGSPSHRVDAWCRGADLVAVYDTDDGPRVRTTAMWRAAPAWLAGAAPRGAWCREAVVSAQTALLEAEPRIAVVADVAGGAVRQVAFLGAGLRAVAVSAARPHGCIVNWSDGRGLLFLVHPGDAADVGFEAAGGRVRIAARLFPAAVEKGVLVRSRVVAAVGSAPGPGEVPAWAEGIAAAFAASPPVLTT